MTLRRVARSEPDAAPAARRGRDRGRWGPAVRRAVTLDRGQRALRHGRASRSSTGCVGGAKAVGCEGGHDCGLPLRESSSCTVRSPPPQGPAGARGVVHTPGCGLPSVLVSGGDARLDRPHEHRPRRRPAAARRAPGGGRPRGRAHGAAALAHARPARATGAIRTPRWARTGASASVGKARAAADRVVRMLSLSAAAVASTRRSRTAPPTCPSRRRVLRIPNATMFDYECARHPAPRELPAGQPGARPRGDPGGAARGASARRATSSCSYPGLKEEYYLTGFTPDAGRARATGRGPRRAARGRADPARLRAVPRRPESALLPRVLGRLGEGGAQTVVLPRTPEQADAVDALGIEGVHVPRRAVDGRSLVALADLLVSAGGR